MDKRRVIAQLFEYGAAVWGNSYSDIFLELDNKKESIREKFDVDSEEELRDLLKRIKENIKQGKFNFVIAMDQIDDRLKDMIRYINLHSSFRLFALELKFYKYNDINIVIPDMRWLEINETASPSKYYWDEEKILEKINKNFEGEKREALKKLFEFSRKYSKKMRFGRTETGSFNPVFEKSYQNFSLYSVNVSNGRIVLNLGAKTFDKKGIENKKKWISKLSELNGFEKLLAVYDSLKYPNIQLKDWYKQVDKFIEITKEVFC